MSEQAAEHRAGDTDAASTMLTMMADSRSTKRRTSKPTAAASSSASDSALPTHSAPCYILSSSGVRYVRPYDNEFVFFVKKRWWDHGLLDMLQVEYKNPIAHFYASLLEHNRIILLPSGASKPMPTAALQTHILKPNDRITLKLHRHEPPVPDNGKPIEIIHYAPISASSAASSSSMAATIPSSANEFSSSLACETLVVNKPAGMPVHASGRYLHNTVVGRLKVELGIEAFRKSTIFPLCSVAHTTALRFSMLTFLMCLFVFSQLCIVWIASHQVC